MPSIRGVRIIWWFLFVIRNCFGYILMIDMGVAHVLTYLIVDLPVSGTQSDQNSASSSVLHHSMMSINLTKKKGERGREVSCESSKIMVTHQTSIPIIVHAYSEKVRP